MDIIQESLLPNFLNTKLEYSVFLPNSYKNSTEYYPVLYLHDGQNVFGKTGSLDGDGLDYAEYYQLHAQELPQIIIVAIHSPEDRAERTALYSPYCKDFPTKDGSFEPHIDGLGKEYAEWIVHELKPHIDSVYRTKKSNAYTAIGGFSTGGLISTYIILKYPHIFTRLLLESAAFYNWFDCLKTTIGESSFRHLKYIYMDVGTEEFGRLTTKEEFVNGNQWVYKEFLQNGMKKENLKFRILPGKKHCFRNWRERFPTAIQWIFQDIGKGEDMQLRYGVPEDQGMQSAAIIKMIQRLKQEVHSLHGLAVVKNGVVITEAYWAPYAPDVTHEVHSLAKSLNCLAVGYAIGEQFDLNTRPAAVFQDYLDILSAPGIQDLTVEHLLTMCAGGAATSTCFKNVDTSWISHYFTYPLPAKPGTEFHYDTGASYILSSLVTQATGKTSHEILREQIFEPHGITSIEWKTSPEGNTTGGWGLFASLRDLIRIGLFIQEKRRSEDIQDKMAAWIREATNVHVKTNKPKQHKWESGYGYQFWADDRTYSAFGGYGQFIMGSKEENLFIVTIGGCPNTETEVLGDILYELITEHSRIRESVPYSQLEKLIGSLVLPCPDGQPAPASGINLAGTYHLAPNTRNITHITFSECGETLNIVFTVNGEEIPAIAGYQSWRSNDWNTDTSHSWKHFSLAYSVSEDTLVIWKYMTETSYVDKFIFRRSGNGIEGIVTINLSLTGDFHETLTGNALSIEKNRGKI